MKFTSVTALAMMFVVSSVSAFEFGCPSSPAIALDVATKDVAMIKNIWTGKDRIKSVLPAFGDVMYIECAPKKGKKAIRQDCHKAISWLFNTVTHPAWEHLRGPGGEIPKHCFIDDENVYVSWRHKFL